MYCWASWLAWQNKLDKHLAYYIHMQQFCLLQGRRKPNPSVDLWEELFSESKNIYWESVLKKKGSSRKSQWVLLALKKWIVNHIDLNISANEIFAVGYGQDKESTYFATNNWVYMMKHLLSMILNICLWIIYQYLVGGFKNMWSTL